MLARHRRELAAIDESLSTEQARQMEIMREKMKTRNAKLAADKAERQIKMAEIQRARRAEAEAARKHAKEVAVDSEEAKTAAQ